MSQEVSVSPVLQTVTVRAPVADRAISRRAILRRVVVGATLGLAWGVALRAWMALLALEFGDRPQFTWHGTFGAILLPAALMGGILGVAAFSAETSDVKRWRWGIFSPMLFVLGPATLPGFISGLVTTGLGGGAIAVALIGILGGFAFSGFGRRWLRWILGLLTVFLTLAMAYGVYFADRGIAVMPDAGKSFGVLLYFLLMVLLVAGVSAPSRYQTNQSVSE